MNHYGSILYKKELKKYGYEITKIKLKEKIVLIKRI